MKEFDHTMKMAKDLDETEKQHLLDLVLAVRILVVREVVQIVHRGKTVLQDWVMIRCYEVKLVEQEVDCLADLAKEEDYEGVVLRQLMSVVHHSVLLALLLVSALVPHQEEEARMLSLAQAHQLSRAGAR